MNSEDIKKIIDEINSMSFWDKVSIWNEYMVDTVYKNNFLPSTVSKFKIQSIYEWVDSSNEFKCRKPVKSDKTTRGSITLSNHTVNDHTGIYKYYITKNYK